MHPRAAEGGRRRRARVAAKRDSGSGTVHVLADGKLKAVLVGVGITDNRVTEITSGDLWAGDRVIIGENLSTDALAAGNGPHEDVLMSGERRSSRFRG